MRIAYVRYYCFLCFRVVTILKLICTQHLTTCANRVCHTKWFRIMIQTMCMCCRAFYSWTYSYIVSFGRSCDVWKRMLMLDEDEKCHQQQCCEGCSSGCPLLIQPSYGCWWDCVICDTVSRHTFTTKAHCARHARQSAKNFVFQF